MIFPLHMQVKLVFLLEAFLKDCWQKTEMRIQYKMFENLKEYNTLSWECRVASRDSVEPSAVGSWLP